MSLIRASHLSFTYEGAVEPVFEDVCFQIDTTWKLGLIGRNGRGKTTLLRLLMGEEDSQGAISASVPFAYFPYEPPTDVSTGLDLFHSLRPDCQDWELDVELSRLDMDPLISSRSMDTLSPGERTRLLLACLFTGEERFLLIDEPTSHLDEAARRAVAQYLSRKAGFIVVSHDRWLLDSVCDHMLSIGKRQVAVQCGNFSAWQRESDRRERAERDRNEKLKREISRLDEAARRSGAWAKRAEGAKHRKAGGEKVGDKGYAGHKAAKMMGRAKSIEKRRDEAAEEKRGLLRDVEVADALSMPCLAPRSGSVVRLGDIVMFQGTHQVNEDPVRLSVEPGERIAVLGANGAGKSSLLSVILGGGIRFEGERAIQSQIHVSHIPQDTSRLCGSLRDFIAGEDVPLDLYFTLLRKLGFERGELDQRLENLSLGQRRKAALARSLCTPAHLYVWDEPLNYIDVISRVQIEEMILRCKPTMVFVDHDSTFREHVATRSVCL